MECSGRDDPWRGVGSVTPGFCELTLGSLGAYFGVVARLNLVIGRLNLET
jgi:hypothetical protein